MSQKKVQNSPMPHPLLDTVQAKIASGELQADPAQLNAINSLDGLLADLAAPKLGNKKSALGWLFGKTPKVSEDSVRGLYLWGGVGRGKTMLMDLFFDLAHDDTIGWTKRRVHFHAFMQDVHGRIHAWRQKQKSAKDKSADPIPPLAAAMADEVRLLCFDEFAVTDVADAMILARLFTGLFNRGVTVVATSNVEPSSLYENGLNRSFFLPFIELVKSRLDVLELASPTDYRMRTLVNSDVYFIDDAKGFEALWRQVSGNEGEKSVEIELKGRKLSFERSIGGQLRAGFDELCRKPLGSGDYLAIANRFDALFLDGLPVLGEADRNAVKRLINLVDTLYDKGLVLVVSAAAEPAKIYQLEHGTEAFEFQRTVSRLQEMQGSDWITKRKI